MDFLSMYYYCGAPSAVGSRNPTTGITTFQTQPPQKERIRRLGRFESRSSRSLFSEFKLLSLTLALSVILFLALRTYLTSAILRSSLFSLLETLIPAIWPLFISET